MSKKNKLAYLLITSSLLLSLIMSIGDAHANLDESVCASLVVTEIKNLNGTAENSRLIPYWTAICKGILDHIKAAAVVNNNGTANVTTGSSAGTHPVISTGAIQ